MQVGFLTAIFAHMKVTADNKLKNFILIIVSLAAFIQNVYCQANVSDTALYQLKVVRHFESLSEMATEIINLRDNTGYLVFKRDTLIYKSKSKKSARLFDVKICYCDIISFEKYNFGGIMPNRIKVITLDKVYQFGTYKRRTAIQVAQKQMSLCKEKPSRKLVKETTEGNM